MKQLIFEPNPDFRSELDTDGALKPEFRCPVTQIDFNGIHRFVVIWASGHVISENAIKEVGITALSSDYGAFTEDDVIRFICFQFFRQY